MPSDVETAIGKELKTTSLLGGLSNLATGLGGTKANKMFKMKPKQDEPLNMAEVS